MPNTVSIALPTSLTKASDLPITHIILIPGNPGIASYYTFFLKQLSALLNQTSPKLRRRPKDHRYTLTALSLAGFEIKSDEDGTSPKAKEGWQEWWRKKRLYNLEEQSAYLATAIEAHVTSLPTQNHRERPRVILIGHSIGAYLLLQHLGQHREASCDRQPAYDIIGGILLTPTIMDMALSSNGRKFGWVIWLLSGWLGALLAVLAWIVSGAWCERFISDEEGKKDAKAGFLDRIMGYVAWNWRNEFEWAVGRAAGLERRREEGMEGIRSTRAWWASGWGVWETLYLAHDELKTVTTDIWDESIWGSATASSALSSTSGAPPKLFFLFARKDHWVADRTRDDMIALRGWSEGEGEDWKPRMEIAEEEVEHGFCLRNSEVVAERVAGWVRQVVER